MQKKLALELDRYLEKMDRGEPVDVVPENDEDDRRLESLLETARSLQEYRRGLIVDDRG